MTIGWNDNIKKELGACGQNVMIGHNVIFLRPKEVFLGDNVRIDPFSMINCSLEAHGNNQIGSFTLMNGRKTVVLCKWVGFGYGVKILTGSEDFTGEFGPANDHFGENISDEGDVKILPFCSLLTNVVVMPKVTIPEGVVIGANTLVTAKQKLYPYCIHAGNPIRLIKERNKDNINKYAKEWMSK